MPDAVPPADDDAPRGGGRGWKLAAIISVALAAIAVGVLGSLLFFGGSSTKGSDVRACVDTGGSRDFSGGAKHDVPCPPKGAKATIGLVQKTSSGGFTIRVVRNGKLSGDIKQLHVRKPDQPYIDVAHAQTHAALGQPIRVYTQVIDGRESVVYMDDPPLVG
jgi:hypothetical protein